MKTKFNIRNWLHSIIDKIFRYSMHVASVSILLLTVIDISDLNEWTIEAFGVEKFQIGRIMYYFTILIALSFGLFSISNASNIKQLEDDIQQKGDKIVDLEASLSEIVIETNELFNSYIKLLVKNLDFTHTERISVYKTYNDGFVLIGRSSVNPNLMQKGRAKYPIKEGFIGKGWAEGEFFIDDLPDPSAKKGDPYFKRMNEISEIGRDIVDNLNMQSRTYFVYRINGYDSNPKAVIVVESEKEKAFSKDEIINNLQGVKQPLIMFIEKNNGVKLLERNSLGL